MLAIKMIPLTCLASTEKLKSLNAAGKKKRLLNLFGHWCKEVVELISETQEDMILRRDIYDRDMIYTWGIGRVTLLGDAAHPMQPNLGQGGCMAIEVCSFTTKLHRLIFQYPKKQYLID
jgi:2-polyprenyl-6-methoxyphenol hydroxylase-like FAD-dependent oxidoreductase